jgi:hypothetical protein
MPPVRLQGSLPNPTIYDLFQSVAVWGKSGILHLERDGAFKAIQFERGRIRFAATNRPDERLGALAVQQRLATWWQVQEAAREIGAEKRLGAVLVDRGILSVAEQEHLIRHQIQGIVVDALGWKTGVFRFVPISRPVAELVTIDWSASDAILEEARRSGDEVALWTEAGGTGGRPRLAGAGSLPLPAQLDDVEKRVLTAIDGRRTLAEVATAAAVPGIAAARCVAALVRAGCAESEPGLAEASAARPSREQTIPGRLRITNPAEPGGARYTFASTGPGEETESQPGGPRLVDPGIRAARSVILDLAERLDQLDHYQVLGLQPGAAPDEIQRAFQQRAIRFHPDRFIEPGLGDLRSVLRRAYDAIRIASGTLLDPEARAEYDAQRERRRTLATEQEACEGAGAQAYLDRGTQLVRDGRLLDAIPAFREALRLRPELGVAHYRLGQALLAVPGGAPAAREHLRLACESEPANPRYRDALAAARPVESAAPPPPLRERLARWLHLDAE